MLEGGARRGAGRGSSAERVRWKGPLEGGSTARRGSSMGSSKEVQQGKGFQHGDPAGVLAVTPFLFVTKNHGKGGCRTCG